MKKLLFISALILAFSFALQAQVIVKVIPIGPKVVLVKPPCPGPKFVWIDGHWKWDKMSKEYVWVPGHWIKAKKARIWIDGHWVEAPGGWKWITGHWGRR